jgi:hypothetical protein
MGSYTFANIDKVLGSILGNHFSISPSVFLLLPQQLPQHWRIVVLLEHFSGEETGKNWVVTVQDICQMLQSHHTVLGKVLFDH